MAAVFSIRHYLIDRVAGLIVKGGYFRAAFVWGSAILPHPSLILNSLNPPPPNSHLAPAEGLLSSERLRVFVHVCVCVRGLRAGLLCGLLFAFHQQRAKCSRLHGPELQWRDGGQGDKMGGGKVMGLSWWEYLTPSGWPVVSRLIVESYLLTPIRKPSVLGRLYVEYCAHGNLLNQVIVVSISL